MINIITRQGFKLVSQILLLIIFRQMVSFFKYYNNGQLCNTNYYRMKHLYQYNNITPPTLHKPDINFNQNPYIPHPTTQPIYLNNRKHKKQKNQINTNQFDSPQISKPCFTPQNSKSHRFSTRSMSSTTSLSNSKSFISGLSEVNFTTQNMLIQKKVSPAPRASNEYGLMSKTVSNYEKAIHSHHPSYHDLLEENKKLKRIINEQYLPLKQQLNRMQEQGQERDYLITQLEWKIKQLYKQLRGP